MTWRVTIVPEIDFLSDVAVKHALPYAASFLDSTAAATDSACWKRISAATNPGISGG